MVASITATRPARRVWAWTGQVRRTEAACLDDNDRLGMEAEKRRGTAGPRRPAVLTEGYFLPLLLSSMALTMMVTIANAALSQGFMRFLLLQTDSMG